MVIHDKTAQRILSTLIRRPRAAPAVRLAEDGVERRKTLEECFKTIWPLGWYKPISGVAEAVSIAMRTAAALGAEYGFRKVDEAWGMIPKTASGSSAADHENKGQSMSGIFHIDTDATMRDEEHGEVAGSVAAPTAEPVAWGVMVGGKIDRTQFADALFVDKASAESWCKTESLQGTGTVVGLYPPPQPRGWLTDEEVKCLERMAAGNIGTEEEVRKRGGDGYMQRAARTKEILRGLIARNSPPRVKLPPAVHTDILAALAAAGLDVESQS
jgi:hypothetical protein